jgi:phosphatidylinositol alpha-mannosyltransferase
MAMGKPVVASNIPGYASVITDGVDGILTPPKDDRAIARVLISLLNNSTLRREMGERGRKTAQQYRWEDIAQRILDFYLETLDLAANKKQQVESKQPVKV